MNIPSRASSKKSKDTGTWTFALSFFGKLETVTVNKRSLREARTTIQKIYPGVKILKESMH